MMAFRNLAHNKFRTMLSITGIAIAVVSIILLGSIGNGLIKTGERTLEKSSMQMWMTGKAIDLESQFSGGKEGKIADAHKLGNELIKNGNIEWATPVLTEIVYAYREGAEPKAVFGLGLEGTGGSFVSIIQGKGLESDTHYNNGLYSGPWMSDILLDERAAKFLEANIGDTLYIGKTLTEAGKQKFTIVGLTNSLSSFSSGPMVVFYLSELQDISGNNYYDTVNLMMLRLKDPSRAEETQKQLELEYPDQTVSTNLNLIKKIVKQNFPILASAFSIVFLAVIMGCILIVNTVLLSLNERKNEIGILKVMGFMRWSIFKYVGFEGFLVCMIGGITGVIFSIPLAEILNMMVYKMVGFNDLVLIDNTYIYMGMSVAIFTGLLTSFLAIMQISRMKAAELLRGL